MPKPIRHSVIDRRTGGRSLLEGEFPDEEWNTLLEFADCVEQLRETEFARAGLQAKYTIEMTAERGPHNPHPLPPPGHVAEFLHRLRPIVLSSERTSFERVTGILKRRLPHPRVRGTIDRAIREFSGDASQSSYTITVNDVVLNSEAALRVWLNAYEYHRDRDKQKQLEALHGTMPSEITRAIFINIMIDKAVAAGPIAHLIHYLDGRLGPSLKVGRDVADVVPPAAT